MTITAKAPGVTLARPRTPTRPRRGMRRVVYVVVQWTVVWGLVYAFWRWLLTPHVDPLFLAGPDPTLARIWHWAGDGSLWAMVRTTMGESLAGLAIGTAAAVLLVLLVASASQLVGEVIEPAISALYAMPKFVFAPILFVWLGGGFTSILVFVILNTFPIVFVNTMIGVRTVDPSRVQMMRLLGASRLQVARKLLLPHTFGYLATGLTVAANHSIAAAVGAEILFGATAGLGGTLFVSSEYFNARDGLAALLVATVISAIYMQVFQSLADRNVRNREGTSAGR